MPPLKVLRRGLIAESTETFLLKSKAPEQPLSRAVYVRFYSNKVKDKQKNQVKHTYALIEAKFFRERQNETKRG